MWLLTADPIVGISVFFAELFQVIELQALLRRDQDRKHTLVLPHLFALSH